jgi:hypothetical protein
VNEARDSAKRAYKKKLADEGRDYKFISAKMTEKFGNDDVVPAPVCTPTYWPSHVGLDEREQWRKAEARLEAQLDAQFGRRLPVQVSLQPVSKKEAEPPTKEELERQRLDLIEDTKHIEIPDFGPLPKWDDPLTPEQVQRIYEHNRRRDPALTNNEDEHDHGPVYDKNGYIIDPDQDEEKE